MNLHEITWHEFHKSIGPELGSGMQDKEAGYIKLHSITEISADFPRKLQDGRSKFTLGKLGVGNVVTREAKTTRLLDEIQSENGTRLEARFWDPGSGLNQKCVLDDTEMKVDSWDIS